MENYMQYIEINPEIMFGKPVVKGTRITVELILEDLSYGRSFDEILLSYPNLSQVHISAALAFAADSIKGERVYSIAS